MRGTIESHTFNVSDVTPTTKPLLDRPYDEAIADAVGQAEAYSKDHGRLSLFVASHPLIAALHGAFSSHAPLCLSPDIIWLTITQGLAVHVNQHAEKLRKHFVSHEGKVKIRIDRNEFVKGSPDNDWPSAFSEFSDGVRGHIGEKTHDLIVANFSTTGPVERAASEIVLLDTMQSYFEYEMSSVCGIPSITLEGTEEDWQSIATRVESFRAYDLDWWIDPLVPVLTQFAEAAAGRVDRNFWDSIYKWQGPEGSGSPTVSGWIIKLFPYLKRDCEDYKRNKWLDVEPKREWGPDRGVLPHGPARAPFNWICGDTEYKMEFVGGLLSISQDPRTLVIRPEIGWAVREAQSGVLNRHFPCDGESEIVEDWWL